MLANKVNIVEVGPRDGLQNEKALLSSQLKIDLIEKLALAGIKYIEATSFVSPKWVPQMADHHQVMNSIKRHSGVVYAALTPNLQGYHAARQCHVEEVAVFASASEAFSQKNINCSITQSIERFIEVIEQAKKDQVRVRAYISCVLGCPYQGKVAPQAVAELVSQLYQLGCYQISLGDTIGTGNPQSTENLLKEVAKKVPIDYLAGHFHDTYGLALANIYSALQFGITTFDSSVAGLGGCPYASGASGNVATEDLLWLLNSLSIETGVDLAQIVATARWVNSQLGKENSSKLSRAYQITG